MKTTVLSVPRVVLLAKPVPVVLLTSLTGNAVQLFSIGHERSNTHGYISLTMFAFSIQG